MNLLLCIFILILLCKIVGGYKKGMIRELISFISLIVLSFVVVLIGKAIFNYLEGEMIAVVVSLFLLAILGTLHHLLGVVFFSAKLISKLPIVKWLDKVLGMLVGVLETVFILWIVYTFILFQGLGIFGQMILSYTQESGMLTFFYENNYLYVLFNEVILKYISYY